MKSVFELWREEAGQDLSEYALLMALIAFSSISAMQRVAQAVTNIYGSVANNLSTT